MTAKDPLLPSRSARGLTERLLATLPSSAPGLFNPWFSSCEHDAPLNTVVSKQLRLAAHLDCDARWLLVGEAPGYQGCRYTGVAFTSEKLLIDGVVPRLPRLDHRLTTRDRPFAEPSATVVWKTLHRLRIAEHVVLWNALQMHPFRESDAWSNRAPRRNELELGSAAMDLLTRHFTQAKIVAVGRKAEALLSGLGHNSFVTVRHPSMGGASEFSAQLSRVVSS